MTAGRRPTEALGTAHVVVVGASLAGLATAAGLSCRVGRVTLVERDAPPEPGALRRGVPQGAHAHILLPSGLRALEELLPGVAADVTDAGGHIIPAPEIRFHMGVGRLAISDDSMAVTGATRPLLEAVVRERVAALPEVDLVSAREVEDLVVDASGQRVAGVRLGATEGAQHEVVAADLVVDASGRRSRTPDWLDAHGWPAPDEERMQVGVHYSTRLFRRDPADLGGCRHVLTAAPPGVRRGGLALAVEGDRWLVTLVGTVGERPPTDVDDFVAYAADLWQPDIGGLVAGADPLGEGATGGFPAHLRRRYDRLRRFPERYVVIGDAVCSLSPVYAQGMAVAFREALLLGEVVDRHGLEAVGRRFARRSRSLVDTAWTMATSADLADPGLEGPRPVSWRLLSRYLDRAVRVAVTDSVVADALLAVNALVAPPPTMLRPRILVHVLGGRRRGEAESHTPPGPSGSVPADGAPGATTATGTGPGGAGRRGARPRPAPTRASAPE